MYCQGVISNFEIAVKIYEKHLQRSSSKVGASICKSDIVG